MVPFLDTVISGSIWPDEKKKKLSLPKSNAFNDCVHFKFPDEVLK